MEYYFRLWNPHQLNTARGIAKMLQDFANEGLAPRQVADPNYFKSYPGIVKGAVSEQDELLGIRANSFRTLGHDGIEYEFDSLDLLIVGKEHQMEGVGTKLFNQLFGDIDSKFHFPRWPIILKTHKEYGSPEFYEKRGMHALKNGVTHISTEHDPYIMHLFGHTGKGQYEAFMQNLNKIANEVRVIKR